MRASILIWLFILSTFTISQGAVFEWPQFRGPERDNVSRETGLMKKWPSSGPRLLWKAEGIGEGYSTVAIAKGLIYTTGNIGNDTIITALDVDGGVKWTVKNGPAYKRDKPGTRSTPTIDEGRLYHENADGDIVCLVADTGRKIWSLNILERFDGRNITWALAESLLIDGNNVICTPGGEKVGMATLDKKTGKTVWTCEGTNEKPGYSSPIAFKYKGLRQIVVLMAKSVAGVNADTGRLLWSVKHVTPFDENINTPIYHDGCVFICSRTTGSRLFRLKVDGDRASVEEVWNSKLLESQHGGIILFDGYLYGASRSPSLGPWMCLDFATGRQMYAEPGIGPGSLTYADGMIYALNQKRTVALVRAVPNAFGIISRFSIPKGGRGPTWAHPVVCNGRLYIRHGNLLYCYDVKANRTSR